MITGRVSALHLLVSIPFRRSGTQDVAIECVVDTGFTGELCLPPNAVAALELPFRYELQVRLADDSALLLRVHNAIIVWSGVARDIDVLATGKRPLIGTALLDGFELLSQFRENGLVTIAEL